MKEREGAHGHIWDVEELVCLHKQVTERVGCLHSPRHVELAEAIIRGLGTKDPVTQRAIRSATRPRRLSPYSSRRYHGP